MADNTQVLREYLISLGFRVSTAETKKFTNTLGGINKGALAAGAAVAGFAAATVAMVQTFTGQMEKLYYASRRTGSAVGSLQAMQFGAKQIGISGEAIMSSIEGMAKALRNSPGLQQMLESFGVKVQGRDMSDVVRDMVRSFRQLPPYLATKLAGMFGMDEDTFVMMAQGLEKLDEAAAKRKQMAADAGVDAEAAAAAAVRYRNILDQTYERVGMLKDALSIALLLPMEKAVVFADQFLDRLTKAVGQSTGVGDFAKRMGWTAEAPRMVDSSKPPNGEQEVVGSGGLLNREARETLMGWRDAIVGYGRGGSAVGRASRVGQGRGFVNNYGPPGASSGGGAPMRENSAELFAGLEKQYGLPAGVLDALWAQESSRGKNMVSPDSSSRGHFQMIKSNRDAYGVTDPNNLSQGAVAAAEMMADLLKSTGGNLKQAVAQWNGGSPGSRYLGTAANDKYTGEVMARIENNNKFEIHGGSATEIANTVAKRLEATAGNALRDLKGAGQ